MAVTAIDAVIIDENEICPQTFESSKVPEVPRFKPPRKRNPQ
jgi:hypothetical protein